MNKKQVIALWSIALVASIGVVLATFVIWYDPNPHTLDNLLAEPGKDLIKGQWNISSATRVGIVFINLIRYVLPVLIIGGSIFFSLRDKKS